MNVCKNCGWESKAYVPHVTRREQYIISQALHYAINALESVEPEYLQERSNIEDMKRLREHVFPFFVDIQA